MLPDSTVKELLAKENLRYYNSVYTPIVTLWAMISQVLDPDKSRKNHLRKTDFRRGKKLGIGDHQVVWNKPQQCPKHMIHEEFEELPSNFRVREVCLRIQRRGFREERIMDLFVVRT